MPSRPEPRWRLDPKPRQYRMLNENGDWSWNARDRRIASVTSVLAGEQENLQNWAITQTAAAHQLALELLGVDLGTDLTLAELAELTGQMPNQVRDAKAAIGTACHTYFAAMLDDGGELNGALPPYGYLTAIDAFLATCEPAAVYDHLGPRVERAVGSEDLAVAGTYDAQVQMLDYRDRLVTHRIDLKSSNSVQGKAFAQLAAYEMLAMGCGEQRSDLLTVVHITPLGEWKMHSIATGSPEHEDAREYFLAALTLHRTGKPLSKLVN